MPRRSRHGIAARVVLTALCLAMLATPVASAAWPPDVMHHSVVVSRIGNTSRFANAVQAARVAHPAWTGVDRVIIASGKDDALCNPMMAASLCWAYDAPLFLVGSTLPADVSTALSEIRSLNPTVTVTVVDNTTTVPWSLLHSIKLSAGASSTVEQPWPTASRYALGRAIAVRVRAEAAASARTIPSAAFIVNGLTPTGMLQGAPAAAISARTGIPVIVTRQDVAPASTVSAIDESGATERIVIGSGSAVSSAVAAKLGANARWSASTLSWNAASVATKAMGKGWTGSDSVVFYKTLGDAVGGAQIAGAGNGVSVYVAGTRLERPTATLLSKITTTPAGGWLIGPTSTIPFSLQREIRGAPAVPTVTSLHRYEGSKARVTGRVGSNTTKVLLYVNGVQKGSKAVAPYGSYDFGMIPVPSGRSTWRITAWNPDGRITAVAKRVERLKYPYATCIIIDKSEFKLYWVKDNVLVKTYPVATGRPSMETPTRLWRVGAKVQCDPRGVYGPRKLMLWKWTGSGWEYTNYAIHGTNEPWVIGTKASHGCIRLYNSDILDFWPRVPLYTKVITRE